MATAAKKAHPEADKNLVEISWNDITLKVKKKFAMFAFMKALEKNPIEAMEIILTEDTLEALAKTEMDFEDLRDLLSTVSKGLGVEDEGN